MKKKAKKPSTILNLQKETVTILNKKQQAKVAGGDGPIITVHQTSIIWH